MNKYKLNIGNLFLISGLVMLMAALLFGLLAAIIYLSPGFLKEQLGFVSLRPLHVSSAMFWIILSATGCVYNGLRITAKEQPSLNIGMVQWLLWLLAIAGIFSSYFLKKFGGREYWEFPPVWALPIALAWLLFVFNFYGLVKKIRKWPVYVWMWLTGIVFFLFTFTENYLWMIPYFRESFVTDMTIQWKVNGSLVGAWNQMIYGTAFFLMDKISGNKKTGQNNMAFAMYFLGLFNLMFNWGHHIYTLPTEKYIRYIGYIVSMTEWVFFIKILYSWKSQVNTINKHYHHFAYRFIMASDFWVFLNMGQAVLMSIPAVNIYTHGTHVTVAHAMGTTIGINSMILLAACFEFLLPEKTLPTKTLTISFWMLQGSLLVFWLSLNTAGILKGLWQLSEQRSSYSQMTESLTPYFISFFISGIILVICFTVFAVYLLKNSRKAITHLSELNHHE